MGGGALLAAHAHQGDSRQLTKTIQLEFDWLIALENLRRGIMVTDTALDDLAGPRIIQVNSAQNPTFAIVLNEDHST